MRRHRTLQRLKHLWYSVTEPSSAVYDEEQRRQARLFASLLAALIILSLVSVPGWLLPQADGSTAQHRQSFFLNLAMNLFLLVPYGLSRTRHYTLGVKLFVGFASLSMFMLALPGTTDSDYFILDYLIAPLFICSLFLSLRATMILLFAHITGILLFGAVIKFPGFRQADIYTGPLTFNVLVSFVILLVMYYRNRLERERQAALRESESKYRMLIEQASDGIGVVDQQGHFIELNSALRQMLGYSQEEILELPTRDVIAQADLANSEARLEQLRLTGAILTTLELRRKDGTQFPVEISAKRLDDGRIQAIVRDITARKQADEALRLSEQRFSRAFQASPLPICITTIHDQRLIDANESFFRFFGFSEVAIGRAVTELGPQLNFVDPAAVMQKFETKPPLRNIETSVGTMSGEMRDVLVSIEFIELNGQPCALSIFQDITERKRAEEALSQERGLLRTLIDNLPDYIFVKDAEGRFLISNAAHSRAAQRAAADSLAGRTASDLFPPGFAEQFQADDKAVLQSAQALINAERMTVGEDGNPRWVLTTKVPLRDQEGKVTGLVGISRDISERKQAEEALRKIQQAEYEQRVLAEALRDTAAALTSALNPEVVMQRILENLGRVVAHDAANIMLIEGDSARVAYQHGYPSQTGVDEQLPTLSLNSTIFREMIISSSPCVIPDIGTRADWVRVPHREWIRSYVGAPLRAHGSTLGFINLDSTTPGFFNRIHGERLQVFADQAAIAIENAQLYNELLRYATRLELHVAERTAELSHAKERVEAILSNSSDAMAMLDMDGTISQTNPAFIAMFGYQPFGTSLTSLAETDSGQALADAIQMVMHSGQPGRLEISARNQSSNMFRADVALSPIRHPNGNASNEGPSGVVCSIRDVTERRRAEETLAQERNLLRTVIDNVPDCVYVKDIDGRFVLSNSSLARYWHTTPDAIVGKTDVDFFPEDLAAHFYQDERLIIATGKPLMNQEETSSDLAGNKHIFLTTKVPLFDNHQRVIGLVGTSRDITGSKQIEKELQDLNRLKTEFLSTAAHELRTPLTSIRGFSEILLSRSFDGERQRRYLSLINEQSGQLGKLIDDLLDITRLEARRSLALEFGPVDLAQLLDKATATFAESAPRHQIRVESLPQPPIVKGDAFRLMQVINNLLSNAVKYSPKGGAVTIRTRLLADAVELCVQDEGIGMTAEQQAHLFEKFYRADASNTTISGTGLGLSICKLIVELHAGKIWVDSEFGVGTKSYFSLPLANNC